MTGTSVLADTLDVAAAAADQTATEQRQAAREARTLARRSRNGHAPEAVQLSGLLAMLTASASRLTAAAHTLRRGWVRALTEQGHSIRQIGGLLGVSHQRVSALLSRPDRQPDRTGD